MPFTAVFVISLAFATLVACIWALVSSFSWPAATICLLIAVVPPFIHLIANTADSSD